MRRNFVRADAVPSPGGARAVREKMGSSALGSAGVGARLSLMTAEPLSALSGRSEASQPVRRHARGLAGRELRAAAGASRARTADQITSVPINDLSPSSLICLWRAIDAARLWT